MRLFDKELDIKKYDCSRDGIDYPAMYFPVINLYIQSVSMCNARCDFCNTRNKENDFDFEKLKEIIKEIEKNDLCLGKVAITGGEPLLNVDRVLGILDVCSRNYITLNTNAYNIDRLKIVGGDERVREIHISKHHYDNDINDSIMKLKTPTLEELSNLNFANKMKINCVFQVGGIETYDDMIMMLETLGEYHLKELRSISMLPLTDVGARKYVELTPIMKQCEHFLNDGYLYDKKMCKCFEFVYLTKSGVLVKNTIRETMNDDYSCVKQLVYDGKHLYDGFKKKNIII